MTKVVVYGAAFDDPVILEPFAMKANLVFEDQPLNSTNFHSDADVMVVFSNSIIKAEYISRHLKAIVSRTTGLDHIECFDTLKNLRIPVLRPKGYATQSVVEYSLSAISRELTGSYFDERGGQDKSEIASQKIVIVGAGAIGRRLSSILQAIGADVFLVSSSGRKNTYSYSQLEELVKEADFLCLHASLKEVNKKVINKKVISKIKYSTVLINAARGDMVDNAALLEALDNNRLNRAYIDLVAEDDYTQRVISHPKVVFTGHTAWKSQPALQKSRDFLLSSLQALCK